MMRIEAWMEHKELKRQERLSRESQAEILRRLKANSLLAPLYWNVGERGSVYANFQRYSDDSARELAKALMDALWDLTTGEVLVRVWD